MSLVIKHCIEKIRKCFDEHNQGADLIRYGHAEILANVDIVYTLCRHYYTFPDLEVDEVESWQKKYLEAYDALLPIQEMTSEKQKQHILTHRAIVVATFYHLLRTVNELWGEE